MQDFKGSELHIGDKVIFVNGSYTTFYLSEGVVNDIYQHPSTKEILCYIKDEHGKGYGCVRSDEVAKVGDTDGKA